VAGSQSTGGSGDEQGTLISFPRSKWVPDDGIQPLNTGNGHEAAGDGDPPATDDIDESVVLGSRSPAIEATDFWASGDTQEFVGAAPSAYRSPPTDGIESEGGGGGRTTRRAWRSVSLTRLLPRAQLVASVVVVMLLAAGGAAAWQLLGGTTRASKPPATARRSSLTYTAKSSRTSTDSYAIAAAHLHRPVPISHADASTRRAAVHRVTPAHRAVAPAHTEGVSYHAPVMTTPANNVTTRGGGASCRCGFDTG
jgi:hypothetical protein